MLRPVAALASMLFVSPAAALETVRIAISTTEGPVRISGGGLAFGADGDGVTLQPAAAEAVTVTNVSGALYLDGRRWNGGSVRFRTAEEAIGAGKVQVRGDVVVKAHGRRLRLINVVALEDYLAAVLGSEMPHHFPEEALKAQAVAARTYALHKKLSAYDADFHLGSSVLHQVYGGIGREDERTRAAVLATRGWVLTYDLSPVEAYFHGSCGGRTASGGEALSRDLPYLVPVGCGCGSLPVTRWSLALSREELSALFPGAEDLVPAGRTATGRVRSVRLGNANVDAVTFRAKAGYSRVKSLAFEVERKGDGFLLQGRGSGHGAGMCQWGAKVFADQGWTFDQILAHYYPGTELQQLY